MDIVDATNLERNLYLALQLLELEVPVVLVCNMMDQVEVRGDKLDLKKLSDQLGIAVVPTTGHKRLGMEQLLATASGVAEHAGGQRRPLYSADLERSIREIATAVRATPKASTAPPEWMAIKLLEGDQEIEAEWAGTLASTVSAGQRERLAARFQESAETIIAQERYTLIANVCHAAIIPAASGGRTISDRLDTVLTHRIWGLPDISRDHVSHLPCHFQTGQLPFRLASVRNGEAVCPACWALVAGSESPLKSLLLDGVIAGVGNVIVFLPSILICFSPSACSKTPATCRALRS